ncbi:MAG: uroporphyrin-III C/tetrapyrrole (Corrin/Porphyrin) methyltransferase, rRNA [Candidatus Parcubacteria bacterium]|jgi:16S rRNA (cytidine1402-2'-O)-methyltransferase
MGTLSVVATPIGNLEDITLRALRVLKESDVVFCEDTRVTGILLKKYDISKPLIRCDEKMETSAAQQAMSMLQEGKRIVLISDAGTPGISDPGARLVSYVREQLPSAKIEAIPGPSALSAALSIAGLQSGEFTFLGFLPHKKGRQTALKEIGHQQLNVVLYESPFRISKLMGELAQYAPERRVVVAKELTKIHEEVLCGFPKDVAEKLVKEGKDKGEFVVIVVAN